MYKSRIQERLLLTVLGLLASNSIVLIGIVMQLSMNMGMSIFVRSMVVSVTAGLCLFALIWLHVMPMGHDQIHESRLRLLMGGRRLIRLSLFLAAINTVIFILPALDWHSYLTLIPEERRLWLYSLNMLGMILYLLSLYTNGWIRILATSRRLGPSVRIICGLMIYLPVIHLFVDIYLCQMALTEVDHELNKKVTDDLRLASQVCATKYPLLLLHGVGFRDLKYLNYWGRVPSELMKNGAVLDYGNQEAWGTIEANGEDIRNRVIEMTEALGCEKVNIIAHSKGGLDARYAVSQLGIDDQVASVTMIGTPHRGSEVIDFVYKLPAGLVRFIGNRINSYFGMLGDKNPDFHVASKQFLRERSEAFNRDNPDVKGVYYQSYATKMKNPLSDPLLIIPYIIVRLMEGPNDGLVNVKSAEWGNFRGVIENKKQRGISHGDIIDLKREDYRGFDVREFYVEMVKELKEMGY